MRGKEWPVREGGLAGLPLRPALSRRLRRLVPWTAGQDRAVPPVGVLVSAALSPVLLTAAFLTAGALQPPSYSPLRETVSAMAGQGATYPWLTTGALFLVGGCYLVTAAGLAGAGIAARALLAVAGLCSIGIAASPNPVTGPTSQHIAWTVLGGAAITVWPAFTARRGPGQPLILSAQACAGVTAVFVALLGWVVFEANFGTMLGLAERLATLVQTSWPFVVAVALRRSRPRPGRGRTGVTGPGT